RYLRQEHEQGTRPSRQGKDPVQIGQTAGVSLRRQRVDTRDEGHRVQRRPSTVGWKEQEGEVRRVRRSCAQQQSAVIERLPYSLTTVPLPLPSLSLFCCSIACIALPLVMLPWSLKPSRGAHFRNLDTSTNLRLLCP
ncbi:hypothetical protein PMAYCL1PPCAC_13487, partial [Pristionchus mayeri]